MRSSTALSRSLILGLLLAPSLTASAWAEDPCDVRDAPRVVAVGDVHGAYDNLVKVLQMSDLVDENVSWAGGKAHLVQTGNLLDHGKDTLQVLDLLMRLEKEAAAAGGRLHALLGNHEVMNLLGDLRFVDPRECCLPSRRTQPAYGGHLAALEIGPDGAMTAIYPDAREPIEEQAAARDRAPGQRKRTSSLLLSRPPGAR